MWSGTNIGWPGPALERLVVAALVGFLIGLERERAETRKARGLFAGVRTFPLIALAGAVPMLVIDITGSALLVASFVAVAGVALVSYLRASAAGSVGATTEIAALTTFLLGTLAGAGEFVVAGAAGVGVAVLLAAKPRLQAFSRALTEQELTAALELAVISVIVLPLLPNRGYGPWQALNPFEIWLIVVLVSGLSFAGFVAIRIVGQRRGLTLTGVAGALVSSTAVTVAMATQARMTSELARTAAAATVLASTIMCVRVAVLVVVFNVGLLPRLLPMLATMMLTGAIAAWILGKRGAAGPEPSGAPVTNPFSLIAALAFGAVYAIILLAVAAAQAFLGTGGIYVAATLAALADVDAVTIAFSRLGGGLIGWQTATAAVSIAVVANTLVKLGIAVFMGGGKFRLYVAAALGMMAFAGGLTGAFIFHLYRV